MDDLLIEAYECVREIERLLSDVNKRITIQKAVNNADTTLEFAQLKNTVSYLEYEF